MKQFKVFCNFTNGLPPVREPLIPAQEVNGSHDKQPINQQ